MLYRGPKGVDRLKVGKNLLLFESLLFTGSLVLWSCMCRSQDFRYFLRQNFPSMLNGFYIIYEKVSGDNSIRTADTMKWE